MNVRQEMEAKYPTLYTHCDGGEIIFNRKTEEIELHDSHDREWLTLPIGPAGMRQMAAKLLKVAGSLETGHPLMQHNSGATVRFKRGHLEVIGPDGACMVGLGMTAAALEAFGAECSRLGRELAGGVPC